MTNGIAIEIIIFLMALNVGILLKLLFFDLRKNKDRLLLYMLGMSISLIGWQVDNLIYFISSDVGVMRFTYDFKLPFVAFTTFFMAILVIRFYRLEFYLNRTSIMIMLIVPCFTLIYSLLSANTDLIRETFSVVQITPIHEVMTTRGIWFWVHTFCCYIFVLGAFILSLYCHNKLPRSYRAPSFILLAGLLIVLVINVLQITGINYQNFDISLVGASFAVIAVYFSVTKSKGVDFITSARNEIYDYLSEGVMVLNDERYVVYINRSARRRINDLGLSVMNELYDNVFESAVNFTSNIEAAPADEDGLDMTFMDKGNEIIFNLSEKPIKDNTGVPIGTLVVMDDVTKNRAIINKLENIGGIDALTGLPNRRSIEKFMANMDYTEKLPIAVISGDINGLKQVNDNLGHKQGDVLIRLVAEIMTDVCPTRGRVSRIGGDEFLIVIPNSNEREVKEIISAMEKVMEEHREYYFKPSVSFGYELKSIMSQSLASIISVADEKMYKIKDAKKEASRRE